MVRCACCIEIFCRCSVVVTAVPCFIISRLRRIIIPYIRFSINLNIIACKCTHGVIHISNFASLYSQIDFNRPCFFSCFIVIVHPNFSCMTINCLYRRKLPCADRHRNQCKLTHCFSFRSACNCHPRNVIIFVDDFIVCNKAVCNIHVVKVPNTHVVQIEVNGNALDGFNICCHEINIIKRTEKDLIKSLVMCLQKDRGTIVSGSINFKAAERGCGVALSVANRKLQCMVSVEQHDIFCGNLAIREFARDFITIHVYLCGTLIKSSCVCFCGILCNIGSKSKMVIRCISANNLFVIQDSRV